MERRREDTDEREDLEDENPGDAPSPRPDENVVDEVGAEVGVRFQDEEPLDPLDKVATRDEHRWELDPASSEDYPERAREESPKSRRPRGA